REGHFRIRSLNTSLIADEIVSISETEFESFGKVDEIINDSTKYFQPKLKTFCAIDLLIPLNQLSQMTVSQWLGKVLSEKMRLYFVVPEDI
ncbi:1675_t:CDS:1, partial [Funneliformis geosporum]